MSGTCVRCGVGHRDESGVCAVCREAGLDRMFTPRPLAEAALAALEGGGQHALRFNDSPGYIRWRMELGASVVHDSIEMEMPHPPDAEVLERIREVMGRPTLPPPLRFDDPPAPGPRWDGEMDSIVRDRLLSPLQKGTLIHNRLAESYFSADKEEACESSD